jgi:hypothetical protein
LSRTLAEDRLKTVSVQLDLRFAPDPWLVATTPPRRPHPEETNVSDQVSRSARLRFMATGAVAALAAAGAIAGTAALAAGPGAKTHAHAVAANCSTTKAPASGLPDKTQAPEPPANPQAFLNDVQQLVAAGTITTAEAQTVDREIQAGRVDTDSLTAAGFTSAQLDAVQQALSNTKRSLASASAGAAAPAK